jgi:hypothetical protein
MFIRDPDDIPPRSLSRQPHRSGRWLSVVWLFGRNPEVQRHSRTSSVPPTGTFMRAAFPQPCLRVEGRVARRPAP